ncbi:MAG: DNA-binding protein WhiA [Bacilli bacterium]
MSFTTNVKDEICKRPSTSSEQISFLSGFFRNNARYKVDKINLFTENNNIKECVIKLTEELYDVKVSLEERTGLNFSKASLFILEITNKVRFILENLCVVDDSFNYIEMPPRYLVDGNEEMRAYLRGVFLSRGSINNPSKSYHLEFLIDEAMEAVFVQKLLNDFDLNAKILTREKGYMLYIKEADKISDFLKLLCANNAVMAFENIRVYRSEKNSVNRLNNCEQANMNKIVQTANEQIGYIKVLKDNMADNLLDDKTKEALEYRVKYPDASLNELSEIISLETGHKITKSGLNHRFRKVKELAFSFLNE